MRLLPRDFGRGVVSNPADREAGNGTRTRGPQLGKLMLYQLSYSRVILSFREYLGGSQGVFGFGVWAGFWEVPSKKTLVGSRKPFISGVFHVK